MDTGFIFSVAVVAALAIGLLVASHFGARQVAAHKGQRAALLAQARAEQEAPEAQEEPEFPFEPEPPREPDERPTRSSGLRRLYERAGG